MAIGTAAAIALAAGATAAGGLTYAASRQQSKAAEEAVEAQRQAAADISEPQKQMMAAFLPEYRKLAPQLSDILQQQMASEQLPENVARQIENWYKRTGTDMGVYGASKRILDSGPINQMYQELTQGKGQMITDALLSEREKGISGTLSFMGMQPTQTYIPTSSYIPETTNFDWSGIGTLLRNVSFGGSPKATPINTAWA